MRKREILFCSVALLTVFCALTSAAVAYAADPVALAGDTTGATKQTISEIGEKLDLESVAKTAAATKIGLNYVWVLLCGMLIFFFQCGFAMVETGFCRAKNASHTMLMNFLVFLVGLVGFLGMGFALMCGGVGNLASLGGQMPLTSEFKIGEWGIFGYSGFLLTGMAYDVGVFAYFFFQMVFMDTTCTIPTGGVAERVKISAVILNALFISAIYYPLYGNWVWGGGWLSQLGSLAGLGHGVVDFAGSSVVHAMGGVAAFAGAIVIGPRIGKYKKDGTSVAIPGHHVPMAVIGTIILFFCWFAFNGGSTLSGTDLRASVVIVNTMIAGAFGGLVATFYTWKMYGKPDLSMACNGSLAGLVAITAPCAFVDSIASIIIGTVAGFLVCWAVVFIDAKLKIDDPVGASAVHMVNGMWGMIALGLFADGTYGDGLNGVAGGVTGLFYGDSGQLWAQLIAVATLCVYGFGSQYLFWKVTDKLIGIRVSAANEIAGLDETEVAPFGYPDFSVKKSLDIPLPAEYAIAGVSDTKK
jgi:Amt family ammonium transporter